MCVCWHIDMTVDERRFIVKPPSDIRAVKGDDVILECAADGGRRSPRLTWRRRSGAALPHNRYSIRLGIYVCLCVNLLLVRYVILCCYYYGTLSTPHCSALTYHIGQFRSGLRHSCLPESAALS